MGRALEVSLRAGGWRGLFAAPIESADPVYRGLRREIVILAEEHPILWGLVGSGTHGASGGVSRVQ